MLIATEAKVMPPVALHSDSDGLYRPVLIGRESLRVRFVTGLPGAGKTLVGLNVATRHRRDLERATHAVSR